MPKSSGYYIVREEALTFTHQLMRTIYDAVHYSGTTEREELMSQIQNVAIEYYARNGWQLEPEVVFAKDLRITCYAA